MQLIIRIEGVYLGDGIFVSTNTTILQRGGNLGPEKEKPTDSAKPYKLVTMDNDGEESVCMEARGCIQIPCDLFDVSI